MRSPSSTWTGWLASRRLAVEERAVGAPLVDDRDQAAVVQPDGRVPPRDGHVIQREGILGRPAQGGLVRVDAEHRAGQPAPDDDQIGRLPVRGPRLRPGRFQRRFAEVRDRFRIHVLAPLGGSGARIRDSVRRGHRGARRSRRRGAGTRIRRHDVRRPVPRRSAARAPALPSTNPRSRCGRASNRRREYLPAEFGVRHPESSRPPILSRWALHRHPGPARRAAGGRGAGRRNWSRSSTAWRSRRSRR